LGLNNTTQVVGSSFTSPIPGTGHAFVYSGGIMRDIGSLAGGTTTATGINDAGEIVGQSVLQEQFPFAFLYKNGVMRNLGSLRGSDRSDAAAINSAGQIAGTSGVGPSQGPNGNQSHAVLWVNGIIMDLGTLGGLNSSGAAINDRGQVVGYSTLAGGDGPDGDYRGFIWSKGRMRDLGTPPDGRQVLPNGMNNHADIVGTYQKGGAQRAFVYGVHGRMRDLTALVDPAQGWTITAAYDINDAGQIAGEACKSSSYCTAVRLDPVQKERPGDAVHGTDERDIMNEGE
jgi:probable HAF family extracellular repeat protein